MKRKKRPKRTMLTRNKPHSFNPRHMKGFLKLIAVSLAALFLIPLASAMSGDLAIYDQNVNFSNSFFVENVSTRIWASVSNNSNADLLGSVRFSANGGNINSDQPISALAGSTDDVFVDWTPPSHGYYDISVLIMPWDASADDSSNNAITKTIYVEKDTDGDGIPDGQDDDIDGDGVKNEDDAFPNDPNEWEDTDGDGTGDNEDDDDDNDGVKDEDDVEPKDPLYSTDEDDDGTADGKDPFPKDSTEWADTDGDGTGDNSDDDIDGDGIHNEEDPYPSNIPPNAEIAQNVYLSDLGETILLDASNSNDPDGEITEYIWKFESEEDPIYGSQIEKTFSTKGLQAATLTVTDDLGQSDSIDITVRVLDYNFLIGSLLFTLLLIALAFYIIYRYNRRALEGKTQKKPKGKPKKSTKKSKKK
jgi:hypothetical protein